MTDALVIHSPTDGAELIEHHRDGSSFLREHGGTRCQASQFAMDAAKEVYEYLRPVRSDYKTNDRFRVGRKVILCWAVERGYNGGFRVNYHREQNLVAIDRVFHLLDGKGILRDTAARWFPP